MYKYEAGWCRRDVEQVIKGKYSLPNKIHGKFKPIEKMVSLTSLCK